MKNNQVVIGWVGKQIVVVLAGDDLAEMIGPTKDRDHSAPWGEFITHVAVGELEIGPWVWRGNRGKSGTAHVTWKTRMTVAQARKKLYRGKS